MNRQQAKEIAALSPQAYTSLGLYHQECLATYGNGIDVQIRFTGHISFTNKLDVEFLKDGPADWRVKPDLQTINGTECAGPLKSWPRDLVVVYMEASSLSAWQTEMDPNLITDFKLLIDRGILYDAAEKAATACKLRHGVAL